MMKEKRRIIGLNKNSNGFTLIEIVVTIAIVSIVLASVFSLTIFGQKMFGKSSDKSEVQTSFRMMSDAVIKNIRYAYGVEILPASAVIPTVEALDLASSNDAYIYSELDADGIRLKYIDKNGIKTIGTTISNLSTSFVLGTGSKGLEFTFDGDYEGESYSLTSEVSILNLPGDDLIIDNSGIDDGVVLRILTDIPFSMSGGLIITSSMSEFITLGVFSPVSLSVTGGKSPYEFSLEAGTLPNGLTLSTTGVISGSPSVIGSYTFKVSVKDADGEIGFTWFATSVVDSASNPDAPEAENLVISGTSQVGLELTPNYDYSSSLDPTPESIEGVSIVKWWRSSKNDGTELEFIVEKVKTVDDIAYTLVNADINKFIYFTIKPIDSSTPPLEGGEVRSFPTNMVFGLGNNAPTISNLSISFDPNLRQLQASYDFSDVDGDTDASTYIWYTTNKNGSGRKKVSESKNFDVVKSDFYSFEVIARDSRFEVGDTYFSEHIEVIVD